MRSIVGMLAEGRRACPSPGQPGRKHCRTGSTHTFAPTHFFGGSTRLLVPDNAKVAVIKACLYEPKVNRTYSELAAHYDTAVLPARPYRPRDKAKVEACVGIVERWLLGRLRRRVWHGMDELRGAVVAMLVELNERPMRRLGRSRQELFEELDRPRLKPLPAEPYVLAEWRHCKVGLNASA